MVSQFRSPGEDALPSDNAVWLGLVGPDGSGKSTFARALIQHLEGQGLHVAHTHGRPQALVRRDPPAGADPTAPHARGPRGAVLSLAKYLLAALDFTVARRRILRDHDVWISERPLLDYEVDPPRYQLAPSVLPVVRRLNRFLATPDSILLLEGDAAVMASRKDELGAAEIERQLAAWHRLQATSPVPIRGIDTTTGEHPDALARAAVPHVQRAGTTWRRAPVKPGRLDVRMLGTDLAALDIYRPIRFVARAADRLGRTLVRAGLTPSCAAPGPYVGGVLAVLRTAGIRPTGVAAAASSEEHRWVLGIAEHGALTHVLKVGRGDDAGLAREASNLRRLTTDPAAGLVTPVATELQVPAALGCSVLAMEVATPDLSPVTDVDVAIAAATRLASSGWTHGDLAPWNMFSDPSGGVHVVDWEDAEPDLRPLRDMVHYLLRLGATTHPEDGERALIELADGDTRFAPLLAASGLDGSRSTVRARISDHLRATHDDEMSDREQSLRVRLLRHLDADPR